MSEFMQKFGEFWKTWGPWISLGLIPTVIAGLSISPKTQPEASFIAKAWDFFKSVLSYFSFATFKDEQGTFQVPVYHPAKKMMARRKGGGGGGAAAGGCAAAIFLFVCISTQPGCCYWNHTCENPNPIVQDGIDCATAALKSEALHFLPTILTILAGNSPDWQDQLDALKATGGDALACALQMAGQDLLNLSQPKPNEGPEASPEMLRKRSVYANGAKKSQDYIAKAGWKFKKGGK